MAKPIRALFVHGVNVDEKDSGWQPGWTQAIETGVEHVGDQVRIDITLADLVKLTVKDLTTLGYDQHPVILGPKAVTAAVPWGNTGKRSKPLARNAGVSEGVRA